jgi:hypothetical protein
MAKIHLCQSQNPLTEKRDQDAMCGKTIKNAVFIAFVDLSQGDIEDIIDGMMMGACANCVSSHWTERYLYAIREGQDEHQPIAA